MDIARNYSTSPMGWYQIAWSSKIHKNKAYRVHAFQKELVIFRGENGKVAIFDAHCPHMGANLAGPGYKVVDNCIRCPFHGWEYDTEGVCQKIPNFERKIPPKARLRNYPTIEQNELIFVYFHPDAKAPDFFLPKLADDENWSGWFKREKEMVGNHFDIAFNGLDLAHFPFIHKTKTLPTMPAIEKSQYSFHAQLRSEYKFFRRVKYADIWFHHHGPGAIYVDFLSPVAGQMIASILPIAENRFVHRVIYRVQKPKLFSWQPFFHGIVALSILRESFQDGMIWDYKIPRENPLLIGNEGPFWQYKHWFEYFYAS